MDGVQPLPSIGVVKLLWSNPRLFWRNLSNLSHSLIFSGFNSMRPLRHKLQIFWSHRPAVLRVHRIHRRMTRLWSLDPRLPSPEHPSTMKSMIVSLAPPTTQIRHPRRNFATRFSHITAHGAVSHIEKLGWHILSVYPVNRPTHKEVRFFTA